MLPAGEHLIAGPAGSLQVLVELPEQPRSDAFAILCHPHPLYGGTLTNKVVHMLAKGCLQLGIPAVRFNFRGVGQSAGEFDQGQGETADLGVVAAWARSHLPGAALWLGGFSFGAYVAVRGHAEIGAERLLLVAPSVTLYSLAHYTRIEIPWAVLQGGADEVIAPAAVEAWVAAQDRPPVFRLLPGVSHFFHGQLPAVREFVQQAWGDS